MLLKNHYRRLKQQHGDDGFSLPELLVAITLFGFVMVFISGMLISGMGNIRELTEKNNTNGSYQNAIEWSSRLIRYITMPTDNSDYPITIARANELEAYSYSGTGRTTEDPYKIRILNDPIRGFIVDVTEPVIIDNNITYTNPPISRVLAQPGEINTTEPMFRYLDRYGSEIVPADPSIGLTLDEMQGIRSITITFENQERNLQVSQTIGLVNLD